MSHRSVTNKNLYAWVAEYCSVFRSNFILEEGMKVNLNPHTEKCKFANRLNTLRRLPSWQQQITKSSEIFVAVLKCSICAYH